MAELFMFICMVLGVIIGRLTVEYEKREVWKYAQSRCKKCDVKDITVVGVEGMSYQEVSPFITQQRGKDEQ